MMTRTHLELVAGVLAEHDAPASLVYAMADAFADASGTAVTPHYDRGRFLAAALTERDVVTITLRTDNASFRYPDGGLSWEAVQSVIGTHTAYPLTPSDERPILDENGNRAGLVERSPAP